MMTAQWVGKPPESQLTWEHGLGPRRRKSGRAVWVIMLSLLAIFSWVDFRLRPAIMTSAETRLRDSASKVINATVSDKVAKSLRYEDLYAIRLDSRGRPVFLQPNTGEINRLASEASLQILEGLRSIDEEQLRIPLGQVLGTRLLAGLGPRIPVKVVPIGTVDSQIINRFEQAGINQTWHKIYLEIKATLQIVAPFQTKGVVVKAQIPLAEGIILGEVPGFYMQVPNQGASFGGEDLQQSNGGQ